MKKSTNTQSRRSFLKVSSLTGGGMMIGFSWLANLIPNEALASTTTANDWVELNNI
jgi:isoquinoline 1-oxidoreductase beta subunit